MSSLKEHHLVEMGIPGCKVHNSLCTFVVVLNACNAHVYMV